MFLYFCKIGKGGVRIKINPDKASSPVRVNSYYFLIACILCFFWW